MNGTSPRISAALHWASYLAWSYFWIGGMFLLLAYQWTPFLWAGLAGALALRYLSKRADPQGFDHHASLAVKLVVAFAFIFLQVFLWRHVYFFRDPNRVIPAGANIVSPADGFVVYVRRWNAEKVPLAIKEGRTIPLEEIIRINGKPRMPEGYIIGIFMTPMSVHVNRSPIDGRITGRAYFQGKPMLEMMNVQLREIFRQKPFEVGSEHIVRNERETLLIEGALPVYLTRIADPYVDKIVTWKKENESVTKGERIGLIKMGSQSDVLFPLTVSGRPVAVRVHEGDYVYGGKTILAEY